MSKLDELITEFCPNGVEYRTIGEICNISRGVVISKDDILNNMGDYPVYSSQTENNGELGKISTYAYDGEYLTWTTDGANAGTVFYRTGKFSVTNVCGLLEIKDSDNLARYIYHVLSLKAPKYVRSGMGNPKLMSNVMENIQIPLPPSPVQAEIARILDNFTELKAELIVELTARKKQYEYYKDRLLTCSEKMEWKELGEFGEVRMCKRILKEQTVNSDGVPFYKIGTFGKEPNAYIPRELFDEYKVKYSYPKVGEILISTSGTIGRIVVFNGQDAYFQDSNIVWIGNDETKVLNKYLFYCYKIAKWNISEGGTIQRLYNENLKKTKIPIPYPNDATKSLEEQQRIVNILDHFDTICNDNSKGLPAEISARQKQYEYYRDKLLTFKKLS